jgi:hypothetical protein
MDGGKDMYSSPDEYRYNFTYLAKIRTIVAILLVFVLLSSIASFTTGLGSRTALAKKSNNKDNGSGDGGSSIGDSSDKSSSNNDKSNSGDNGGSSTNIDNTDNNPSPPPPATTDTGGTEGQTGTTGQEQQQPPAQQEEQQCPTGQHFDTNQNTCVNDATLAPPSQGLARGDLPPSALETSNNPPLSSPPDSAAAKAAEAAAAAAEGAISIPPDGKCPPGYHLQGNWCYPDPITKNSPEAATRQGVGSSTDTETTSNPTPQTEVRQPNANGGCPPGFHLLPPGFVCVKDVSSTPITKNSPEAATRQGIAGSTNTLAPTEGANPPNQFGAGNVDSLPSSALETNANCPAGSHSDAPRGACFPNSQPLSAGGCIPGWHLVSDTHCEKDFAKSDTIPPNTTGDLPLEVGPSKFGQDTQNSIPPASTNPPVTPPANPASQPECVPGYHWDNSQQQCIADSKSDPSNNPDSSRQDLLEKLARYPPDPIKPDNLPPDTLGPNTFAQDTQNNIPPNPIGPK